MGGKGARKFARARSARLPSAVMSLGMRLSQICTAWVRAKAIYRWLITKLPAFGDVEASQVHRKCRAERVFRYAGLACGPFWVFTKARQSLFVVK